MAYASQAGRARTSPKNPQAHATCDRCGLRYNHVDLSWQHDWRGATLQNVRILVCRPCLDTPQEQQRAIVVPADPTPIINARPENFADAETDYRVAAAVPTVDPTTGLPVASATYLTTVDGQSLATIPVGKPLGTSESPSLPVFGGGDYFPPLPILSVIGNGGLTVTVTCSSPHGLSANSQVSAQGLTASGANGAFSITVATATVFLYQCRTAVPAGSLLGASSVVYPVNIGLPLGYAQLPQTGN